MTCASRAEAGLSDRARQFLDRSGWSGAGCEPLTADASARRYFRLQKSPARAVLMDASGNLESLPPFIHLSRHLNGLGLSAPAVLARDEAAGLLLLEDFGDNTFARLLDAGSDAEALYRLATDVLVFLHQHPRAAPEGLRAYHPERMLEDIELFLDWRAPGVSAAGREEFKAVWREALPEAHRVPVSLLLRDYHAANLMLVPGREGIRRAGLLDFQDAYQGPVTYDLVSLLEDARREVSEETRERMLARYLERFPDLDRGAFETSLAVLAAQRHLRVLGIFERLARRDGKDAYKRSHSPRVESRLQRALIHPALQGVKRWITRYAIQD